jgi:hypothetical protein
MMFLAFVIGLIGVLFIGYGVRETLRHYGLKTARNKAEEEISVYATETEIVNKIVELTQRGHLQFNRYYNEQKTNWLSMPKGKVLVIKDRVGKLDVYISNQEVELNDFEKARLRTALGGERD